MNVHEFHIERLRNQIKRIEEDPDPTKLKSNKLLYEMQLETHLAQIEAEHQGRPQSASGILNQALGFATRGEVAQDMSRQTFMPKFLEAARIKGLPVDSSCDMVMYQLALKEAGESIAEVGFPICQIACNSFWMADLYRSHTHELPMYYLDRGFQQNEASIKHHVNQLREYIRLCEKKFPGIIKYDEDKLIELQYYKDAAENLFKEAVKFCFG